MTTDLDGDGLLEIWTGYTFHCKSDVSPSDLKIIMYEGRKKHAMRGETLIVLDDYRAGGEGKMDSAFREAPEAFRRQAMKLWRQWRTRGRADDGAESWPVKGDVVCIEPVSDSLGTGAVVYTREEVWPGEDDEERWETIRLRACRFNGEPGSAEPACAVACKYVKAHPAPLQPLQLLLRRHLRHFKVVPAEDGPDEQSRPFDVAVEEPAHEDVVHQVEFLDALPPPVSFPEAPAPARNAGYRLARSALRTLSSFSTASTGRSTLSESRSGREGADVDPI